MAAAGHSRGRCHIRAFECPICRLHELMQQGLALFWCQTELVAYERSFLEGRFAVFIRWPGRLIAYANGDLVGPFAYLDHCPIVVRGIIIGFFQLVHTRPEPLRGVVLIVRDAGTEYVDE